MVGINLGNLIAGRDTDDLRPASRSESVQTAALGNKTVAKQPAKVADTKAVKTPPTEEEDSDEVKKNTSEWMATLKDPRVKAGFAQLGINLMAGQGFGQALGGGLEATGRVQESRDEEEQREIDRQLEERKIRVLEKNAQTARISATRRRGGGGGGRGSAARSAAKRRTTFNDALAQMKNIGTEDLEGNVIGGVDPLDAMDIAGAVADEGLNLPGFLREYRTNPDVAMQKLNLLRGTATAATGEVAEEDAEVLTEEEPTTSTSLRLDPPNPLDTQAVAEAEAEQNAANAAADQEEAQSLAAQQEAAAANAEAQAFDNMSEDQLEVLIDERQVILDEIADMERTPGNTNVDINRFLRSLDLTPEMIEALLLADQQKFGIWLSGIGDL